MPTAVLVPQTALLVPGVAGRTDVLGAVRRAALEAARALVAGAPTSVVLVAPSFEDRVVEASELCAGLGGLGVAEHFLGWPAPCRLDGCPDHSAASAVPAAAPATAVGLRLLAAAGWPGPTTVVEISAMTQPAPDLVARVRTARAILVLGSLSARRGESAPRAADPRADDVDAWLAADLAAPSGAGLDRLASLDLQTMSELDVGGAAPWALLARAVRGDSGGAEGRCEAVDDSWGVAHGVWTWRWES